MQLKSSDKVFLLIIIALSLGLVVSILTREKCEEFDESIYDQIIIEKDSLINENYKKIDSLKNELSILEDKEIIIEYVYRDKIKYIDSLSFVGVDSLLSEKASQLRSRYSSLH